MTINPSKRDFSATGLEVALCCVDLVPIELVPIDLVSTDFALGDLTKSIAHKLDPLILTNYR